MRLAKRFKSLVSHKRVCVTYLPHGNEVLPEEEDVDLSWHHGGLLHVDIVVEEVLQSRDRAQWLQLVTIALFDLGLWGLWLRANPCDSLKSLDLILSVERRLPLVVPELPARVQRVTLLWEQATHLAHQGRSTCFELLFEEVFR